MKTRKNFWVGFTWKRFLRKVIFFFLFFILFNIIFSVIVQGEKIKDFFTLMNILKYCFLAILLAFFTTLWSDPAEKEDTVD